MATLSSAKLASLESQAVAAAANHQCPPSSVQNAVKYSIDQVVALVLNAGFQGAGAVQMVAVIMAENGGSPKPFNCGVDSNGTIDMGLVQLNSGYHPAATAYNPQQALAQALSTSNHGTDFGKWCTAWADPSNCGHQLGALQPGSPAYGWLSRVTTAINQAGGISGTTWPSLVPTGFSTSGISVPNPLAGVAGAITSAANNAAKEFENLALIAVGAVLMLAAIAILLLLAFRKVGPGIGGAIKGLSPAGMV